MIFDVSYQTGVVPDLHTYNTAMNSLSRNAENVAQTLALMDTIVAQVCPISCHAEVMWHQLS